MTDILQAGRTFFDEDKWPFEAAEDRPVLRSAFRGDAVEFPVYFQARQEQQQICVYSVLPVQAPEDRRLRVSEFVARANYGLVVGNFELDFRDGEIRYKTSADVEGIELPTLFLRNLIYANVLTFDRYVPGLMKVIYGEESAEEAVASVESPPA
jgi:hypothetical protein